MKIAFLVDIFPNLWHTFILNQITGLIDRGHEVDIYAQSPGDTSVLHEDVEKYNLLEKTRYFLPMPANFLFRFLKGFGYLFGNFHKNQTAITKSLNIFKYGREAASMRMAYAALSWLDKPRYDVIHCHFGMMGIFASWLREVNLICCPIITTFHGADVNVLPRLYGHDYYRRLFRNVEFCTVSSNFIRQRVKSLGADEDRIVKLSVGVNMHKFSCRSWDLEPKETINVLTIGSLVEAKGFVYSIKAISKVLTKHHNVLYNIVGEGPLRDQLENLAERLGIKAHVKFLGALPEDKIRKLFCNTDIFMLSSVIGHNGAQEGQGVVLLEAQAAGIPVVSTKVGGIPESVLDGRSGFLVPQRDVDALAEKLCYLIEHPEIWEAMGRLGRKHVKEHYDIEKLNDQLVKLYRQVLHSRQKPTDIQSKKQNLHS